MMISLVNGEMQFQRFGAACFPSLIEALDRGFLSEGDTGKSDSSKGVCARSKIWEGIWERSIVSDKHLQ
jgi:hypothetical protein